MQLYPLNALLLFSQCGPPSDSRLQDRAPVASPCWWLLLISSRAVQLHAETPLSACPSLPWWSSTQSSSHPGKRPSCSTHSSSRHMTHCGVRPDLCLIVSASHPITFCRRGSHMLNMLYTAMICCMKNILMSVWSTYVSVSFHALYINKCILHMLIYLHHVCRDTVWSKTHNYITKKKENINKEKNDYLDFKIFNWGDFLLCLNKNKKTSWRLDQL